MNKIVRLPVSRDFSAVEIISRSSCTPEETALIWKKSALSLPAINRASVVLPVPGGPQSIMERRLPASSIFLRVPFSPTRCSCPTNSSNACGRTLSARGITALGGENNPDSRPWGVRLLWLNFDDFFTIPVHKILLACYPFNFLVVGPQLFNFCLHRGILLF